MAAAAKAAAEAVALAEAERLAAIERARIAEKEKDGPDADINRHLIDMSIAGEDSETEEMDLGEGGDNTTVSPPAKKTKRQSHDVAHSRKQAVEHQLDPASAYKE